MPEYDVLNLENSEEILTSEEIGDAEPETAAEEVPAEPVVEQSEDIEESSSEDTAEPEETPAEPEDDLVAVLTSMRDTITSQAARIDALEQRLAESEAREAARGRKLTGFFAPVADGVNPDPESNPLPRIEKKYIFK